MITIAAILFYGVITFHSANVDEVATLGVRESHYRIQPSELENAPQWTDLDQSPPLPPGKAVRVFDNQWYYEVTLKESVKPGFGATGRRQSATIFVLMNGTFLKPVKERSDRAPEIR